MSNNTNNRQALPSGTEVGSYKIRNVLGEGGFGITYLADHTIMQRQVALKEMLPVDIAIRDSDGHIIARNADGDGDLAWARQRFLEEARNIARCEHASIIKVFDVFEENGTAYMATSYEKGCNLEVWLKRLGRAPTEEEARAILLPILDGLEKVHSAGLLHRDIKPENIYVCDDGHPLLLDFGAAREAIGSRSRPITTLLTPGYAPIEQYASDDVGALGPWSDLYALGATACRMITGTKPVEASKRIRNDTYEPVSQRLSGKFSPQLLTAIDQCLHVIETDRPQTVGAVRSLLIGGNQTVSQTGRSFTGGRPGAMPPPLPGRTVNPPRPPGGVVPQPPRPRSGSSAGIWIALVSVLMLLGLGGSFAFYYVQRQDEQAANKLREHEAERRHQQEMDDLRNEIQRKLKEQTTPSSPPTANTTPPSSSPPTPYTRPYTPPPKSESDTTADKVRKLASNYFSLGDTEAGRTERLQMFASSVYYLDTYMSPSEIESSDKIHAKRWPNQNYNAGVPSVSTSGEGYDATVSLSYEKSNTVETERASGQSTLHFDSDLKINKVTSSFGTADYRIDPDGQKTLVLEFLNSYYNAGDSGTPKFPQYKYFDEDNVRPYFDNTSAAGRAFTTTDIQADIERYQSENPVRTFEMQSGWTVVSGGGTRDITVEGRFSITKGSGSPIYLTNRVRVHIGSPTQLTYSGVPMKITGIGRPEDW